MITTVLYVLLGLALIAIARQVRRDVIRHNERAELLPRLYRVCGYHDGRLS